MTEYETLDSGARQEFSTGMQRDTTAGKPAYHLSMPLDMPLEHQMVTRRAKLMARGAVKYLPRNWEQAATPEELARFKESALRHFLQWYFDEEDEDHAAASQFNQDGAEYVKWRMKQAKEVTVVSTFRPISPETAEDDQRLRGFYNCSDADAADEKARANAVRLSWVREYGA